MSNDTLAHHGIKGMRWGVRRYQNKDGGLTSAGRKRAAKLENEYSKLTGRKPGESSIKSTSSLRKKKIGEMSDDEIRGQIVKATVVLTKGTVGTEELKKEIQQYVKTNTAPYKYPRIVEFRDELPKTISGKIRRVQLREESAAGK